MSKNKNPAAALRAAHKSELRRLRDEAVLVKRFVEHAALWFGPVGASQPQAPAWLVEAATARLAALEQLFREARAAAAPVPAPVPEVPPAPAVEA